MSVIKKAIMSSKVKWYNPSDDSGVVGAIGDYTIRLYVDDVHIFKEDEMIWSKKGDYLEYLNYIESVAVESFELIELLELL